jgi:hypothetical protein
LSTITPIRERSLYRGHGRSYPAGGGNMGEADEVTAPDGRRSGMLRAAGERGRRVHQSTTFDVTVGIGLVTYGFVYLLIAGIAVRLAVTGRHGSDSEYSALDTMAQTRIGEGMLWVTAFGLGALTLWQIFETLWRRNPNENPIGRAFGRTGSLFSAIGYLTLGVSAVRVALAGRAAREGRAVEHTTTALEDVLVRVAVVIAGIVLLVLAVRSIYRGIRRRFVGDLRDGAPRAVVALGQAGYVGKGITYAIVGGMMIWTAIDGQTGPPGLQTVFRMLNLSPAGGVLLLLKALGLALFGVYCFAWAVNRRR